ncbi:CoB--CoM heterodisulfide reductase iron-sulfur subunit B family protein [Natranaerofaba carboxydovora]|uniref:CoB--CoM heterodisulfide reductase iron-sulfur subunit B family protein n=1 Tax=Natranaerofaba carboxydovora TaxID=2742683 RepID=UPI001F144E72|nr:CoB--CoM heterodisulfide reductase iron-sulfur subunit B family protein [Natranaerofaba carboxydovora]UMZ75459.1 8-methylmenaquinol:fumarate reductase membrane anchor subunit [Natranaerofaba carboxydovora]
MLGYYPGCTVRAEEQGFERQTLDLFDYFDVSVKELSEWECCGAVYPLSKDEYTPLLSSARALLQTREEGFDGLITLCSACYHVLQRVKLRLKNDKEAERRVNSIIEEQIPTDVKVYHFLEAIEEYIGFDALKEKVVNSLNGEKIAPYYGCLLLRPYDEIGFGGENKPEAMEKAIEAIGGEVINYPYSSDCCGASLMLTKKEAAYKMSGKIIESAWSAGANRIVTSCPLCKYNLEKTLQEDITDPKMQAGLKIDYITSPLASALNIKHREGGVDKNAV